MATRVRKPMPRTISHDITTADLLASIMLSLPEMDKPPMKKLKETLKGEMLGTAMCSI